MKKTHLDSQDETSHILFVFFRRLGFAGLLFGFEILLVWFVHCNSMKVVVAFVMFAFGMFGHNSEP